MIGKLSGNEFFDLTRIDKPTENFHLGLFGAALTIENDHEMSG